MAADLINAGPPDMSGGYGNAGAAGYYGLQTELLRRAALARQAQLDDDKRKQDALDAELKRESLASVKEQRAAAAAKNAIEAKTAEQTQFTKSHDVGAPLDANEKAVALRLFGSNSVASQPETPAVTNAAPGQTMDLGGVQTPVDETVTVGKAAQDTFGGDVAQKQAALHVKNAQHVVDTLSEKQANGEDLTPVEQSMLYENQMFLSTGKQDKPAAGLVVPKTASEKDQTRYLAIKGKQDTGAPVTPEEASFAKRFVELHPTEAMKQSNREVNINLNQTAANKRQTSTQTFQTKQQFRRELTDNEKTVDKDIERSDRALALLNSPNFVTDAVAGPEFLQIVAGGMGSGLRMTDAELNRINQAQTKIDQFKGQLAKWDILGIGERRTIQDEMRKQMKEALEAVHAARQRKAALAEETLKDLEDADTQNEIDSLHSKYWSDKRTAAQMSGAPAAAPATTSRYKVTVE